MLKWDEVLSAFDGEHNVNVDLRVGVGHEQKMPLLTELGNLFWISYYKYAGPTDLDLAAFRAANLSAVPSGLIMLPQLPGVETPGYFQLSLRDNIRILLQRHGGHREANSAAQEHACVVRPSMMPEHSTGDICVLIFNQSGFRFLNQAILHITQNMKPQDITILGVRLIGLAAVIVGVIGGTSVLIFQAVSSRPVVTTSLHETTYTIIHHNYNLAITMCVVSLVLGVVLIWASRTFGRILTYGFSNDVA